MKCGGCSSAVKRILLGNPEIQSAAVNLLTESAVFKIPAKSDKAALAEQAANLLTKQVTHVGIMLPIACPLLQVCPLIRPLHTCTQRHLLQGFPSRLRTAEEGILGDTEKSREAKQAELRKSILDLGIAWSLALVCCTHHMGHWLHSLGLHSVAHLPILNTMHQTFSNPAASAALGAVALLGPGRKLLVDGAQSLVRYIATFFFVLQQVRA